MKLKSITLVMSSLLVLTSACTKKENPAQTSSQTAVQSAVNQSAASATQADLKIEDVTVGSGTEAVAGKTVSVHYTGKLTDGKEFDSSVKRGQPFQFQLGAGNVIQGWDKGIVGMKVGGKRKLTIPPQLGYGERGAGNVIPPNATLAFDVELLDVK